MSEKGFNIFDDMDDIIVNENDNEIVETKEEPIDLLADDTVVDVKEEIDLPDLLSEDSVKVEEESVPDILTEDEVAPATEETVTDAKKELVVDEVEKETVSCEKTDKAKTKGDSFNNVIDFFSNPIADPDWEDLKTEILTRIDGIKIKSNIPPNVVLLVSSELDSLHSYIHDKFMETKTALDNLTNKEDGVLTVVKATNAKGSNETERKASGVTAAQKYKIGKNTVDLFQLIAETRGRYNFLDGILKQIQFKKELLITVSSALKVLNK
jgi:hypothetical protein|nr:MAG TPA: hypothetical protein [Caudoviricetes sp.]